MPDHREQVDALSHLMEEFGLSEASLSLDGFSVSFRRTAAKQVQYVTSQIEDGHPTEETVYPQPALFVDPPKPKGTPVSSPMNGIFYASPTPSAAPFVRVGDTVSVGQVIGLIEAMKVFNEIPSPVGGTVIEVAAEPGSLVQPGDVLLYIG